jgi:TRAP transporter TAXI family solute receptor
MMVRSKRTLISVPRSAKAVSFRPVAWRGKGLIRIALLLLAGAAIAAIAAAFGIARDYGYLGASILTGSSGGQYYALATRLADRARREHGRLDVIPTAGSIENVTRLATGRGHCAEMFAVVQDGTPVSAAAELELLGRLPEPESLVLLARQGHAFHTFADLRGASIGIGPEGSGTAHLMRQLFEGSDLRGLEVHLSHHELPEQAKLVAQGKLDIAAFVIQEDAEFLRTTIRQYSLDIVSPQDLRGLVARYPWLSLGNIPAGRFDLVRVIPATDKQIARLGTLVITNSCAQRADRIALLMLLAAEIPGFVRNNPPSSTSATTVLPLAPEAHQFFLTGSPEIADRYFPWLVNLMSPAYWVYLVMAVTILFNGMRGLSRFRLWRIDAAREKLETSLKELVDPSLTHTQMRAVPAESFMASPERRGAVQTIVRRLGELRARCQRQTNSIVTPMGDEMFYRYQQSLIDEAMTTAGALLQSSSSPATDPSRSTLVTQSRANAAGETIEERFARQMRNSTGSTR